MKIIITESQYRTLIKEDIVYTSKTEYDKAMIVYNKQKSLYDFSLDVKKYWGKHKYNDYGKISEIVKSQPYNKKFFKFVIEKIPDWSSINMLSGFDICAENRPDKTKIIKVIGNPKIIKWHRVEFGGTGNNFVYFYLPEVKEPLKPTYQPISSEQPKVATQKISDNPISPVEKDFGSVPLRYDNSTSLSRLSGDETPIYGPQSSLIGFIKGRDFIPATGKYTVGMNKSDVELLNNKIELNKYIQNKFGAYINLIQ